MKQSKPGYSYKKGEQITGTYYGVAFSGVVIENRQHTIRHEIFEVSVKLDQPLTLFSSTRDSIIVSITDKCVCINV